MSCGQLALNRAGINVSRYYASEICPHAVAVTQKNFPATKQMGDITQWRDWDIDWSAVDLLIGGSPCQGFSFAGKQLAFDDPRSKMFFVYADILRHLKSLNPECRFLLENVKMKAAHLGVITDTLGVEPEMINSASVSAQNRSRYYWVNWTVTQPSDRGVSLADVLECNVLGNSPGLKPWKDYVPGLLADNFLIDDEPFVFTARNGKQVTIAEDDIRSARTFYETRTAFGKEERKRLSVLHGRDTTPRCKKSKHYVPAPHDKANCLVTVDSFLNWVIDNEGFCRKLTLTEMERLQTVPDGYTSVASDTQRLKMLGNGWTVEVIAHLFSTLPVVDRPPAKVGALELDDLI